MTYDNRVNDQSCFLQDQTIHIYLLHVGRKNTRITVYLEIMININIQINDIASCENYQYVAEEETRVQVVHAIEGL